MDHGLELFIPILKILEIEVSNILYNPGNLGKRIFSIFENGCKHILEYYRPNPDQITYKNRYVYSKSIENQ